MKLPRLNGPLVAAVFASGVVLSSAADEPALQPPGGEKSSKTNVLEAGARLLQRAAPLAVAEN